jgi:hypothetical protein
MGPQTTKVSGPQGKKLESYLWLLWPPPPEEWPLLPLLLCPLLPLLVECEVLGAD